MKILNYQSSLNSCKGFAYITIIFLVTLFCIPLFAIIQLFQQLKVDQETKHICQKNIYKAQEVSKDSIEKLFMINHQQKSLKKLKKIAEATLKVGIATVQPALVSSAHASLKAIEIQKKLLIAQQKFIILKANNEMLIAQFKTKKELEKYFSNLKLRNNRIKSNQNDEFQNQVSYKINYPANSKLSVRLVDKSDEFPTYELESDFTKKQLLQGFWSYQMKTGLLKGTIWNHKSLKKSISCNFTLQKQKMELEIISLPDKFL